MSEMAMDFRVAGVRLHRAALSVVLLITGLSCGAENGQPEMLRPVRFVEVSSGGGSQARTFSGTARAGTESRLSFKVAGTIESLPIVVGSRVSRGDLLAALDPSDYLLIEQESLASLRQAEAQARNADESYQRVKGLYENNNASRSDLESARAGAESARQAVNLARTRVEQAKLQVRYTRLTAPVPGAIASIDVEVNENVQPGQRVVVMTSGDRAEVQAAIPEQLIGRISLGDKALVLIDALPGETFPAIVHEVGVATTGTATTFPVTVQIEDSDPRVRPGMAAEVRFQFHSADSSSLAVVVPSAAVAEDRNGKFVFVLERIEGSVAGVRRRPVSVGDITSQGIEILDGLDQGMLVATAGVSYLREGQKVKLLESGTP
ncbi:MAG TPA: efflux RND transporter periplasmic adaptor subunit [Rhodothermia bacterium]